MPLTEDIVTIPPMDQHNQTLVSNVHPSNWENPTPTDVYNLVVIGGGTAGLVTAIGAAGLGAKVALIEKHLMGGDCLNVGCVPSKAMIRSSRVAAEIDKAFQYGVKVPNGTETDFAAVMERVRKLRAGISHHDSAERYKSLGIDVFLGKAQFKTSETVEVDGKILKFKKAVIATGARAAHPPISGLEEAGFLTNETVFNLTSLPKRFLIVGAGPIGCELAQAFSRLVSEVHLFEAMHGFLPREDQDAADILKNIFEKEKIHSLCCCNILKVEKQGNDKIVHFTAKHEGEKPQTIAVDEILIGVGRIPNVNGLNLELAGIKYDSKTGVQTNDYLQTTNPHIYAAGDICLKYKFTHTADATARIVIQNALFFNTKKVSSLIVPWCTYTDPEIAHVGLYEQEAKEKGIEVETFTREFKEVDRAILDGETEGFVKVHVKKGSDTILGATIISRHAGEMISEITLAMTAKVGLGTIANTIHPYPTQAEAIKQVADAYNRTRLTPRLKKIISNWLRWKR
ncbi:MAG: mercuric reductase [Elusimicrobia bacterium]|nr:mercuric reductase [Elusimicrobiota bacterium]